jgi:hypothetical protein
LRLDFLSGGGGAIRLGFGEDLSGEGEGEGDGEGLAGEGELAGDGDGDGFVGDGDGEGDGFVGGDGVCDGDCEGLVGEGEGEALLGEGEGGEPGVGDWRMSSGMSAGSVSYAPGAGSGEVGGLGGVRHGPHVVSLTCFFLARATSALTSSSVA